MEDGQLSGIVFVVIIFLLMAGVLGAFAYMTYQRKLRRAKSIERGLKMVPIQIHLPPPSEDTAAGSRDVKDVMREKTAQAEVLYNLLAGTATEGFKSKFYGQRHIALEIIATAGTVHFFAAVPVAMVSVVEKSLQTAYPGARMEEVEDHNIFNQEGRLAATMGGEMVLKAESAYPIATYAQLERDPMEALITTLSALTKTDGAAVQIMLRPANAGWVKRSTTLAAKLRKGRQNGLKFSAMDLAKAAVKAPTSQVAPTGQAQSQNLTNLELAAIERIEEKTKHPGFETLVRVLVSTESVARSQQLLRDIATTFALFEQPGSNGFKFLPALDVQGLVTAFIFRFFPPELRQTVLNSVELATLFHLPDAQFIPSSNVERQASKEVDGPVQLPLTGLLFGYNEFRGVRKEIRLSPEDRRRHTYVLGQTGTGKSTLLENLAVQDMLSGNGFAFIDPHGDTAEKLLSMVPKNRAEDVIYFNPSDTEYPLGLNLFEFTDPSQKDFIVQETIGMLYKLYDPGHTGIIGPRYEHWYRNAALTLMSDPNGSTFIEIPKVFTDTDYLKQKFRYLKDPTVIDFWTKEMGQTSDYHKSEMLGWFVSKFGAFQNNEVMRNIIGQTKSAFNLRDVMDNKKILIVNLSKGRIGELNSQLLGMIFVIKFQAAAMSRADMPEDQRADFSLYVDEFQNFSTESFASILSEARKYHLNLIVANQFIGQLTPEIRDAVFGNIGTIVAHRMGPEDADFMTKQFAPVFEASDLVNIPNYHAAMRLMIGGLPSQPFTVHNLPPLGTANAELGLAIKQLSAAKFGQTKAMVEADIAARLSGRPAPRPAAAVAPAASAPVPTPAVSPAPAVPAMIEPTMQPVPTLIQPAQPAPVPVAPPAPVPIPAEPAPSSVISEPAPMPAPAPEPMPAPIPPAPVLPPEPVASPTPPPPMPQAEPVVNPQPVPAPMPPALPAPAPVAPVPPAPIPASTPALAPPPIGAPPVELPVPDVTPSVPAASPAPVESPQPVQSSSAGQDDPGTLSFRDITGTDKPASVGAVDDLLQVPLIPPGAEPVQPQESPAPAAAPVGPPEPPPGFAAPPQESEIPDPLAEVPLLGEAAPVVAPVPIPAPAPVLSEPKPVPQPVAMPLAPIGPPEPEFQPQIEPKNLPIAEPQPALPPLSLEPVAAPSAPVVSQPAKQPDVTQNQVNVPDLAATDLGDDTLIHFVDPSMEAVLERTDEEMAIPSVSDEINSLTKPKPVDATPPLVVSVPALGEAAPPAPKPVVAPAPAPASAMPAPIAPPPLPIPTTVAPAPIPEPMPAPVPPPQPDAALAAMAVEPPPIGAPPIGTPVPPVVPPKPPVPPVVAPTPEPIPAPTLPPPAPEPPSAPPVPAPLPVNAKPKALPVPVIEPKLELEAAIKPQPKPDVKPESKPMPAPVKPAAKPAEPPEPKPAEASQRSTDEAVKAVLEEAAKRRLSSEAAAPAPVAEVPVEIKPAPSAPEPKPAVEPIPKPKPEPKIEPKPEPQPEPETNAAAAVAAAEHKIDDLLSTSLIHPDNLHSRLLDPAQETDKPAPVSDASEEIEGLHHRLPDPVGTRGNGESEVMEVSGLQRPEETLHHAMTGGHKVIQPLEPIVPRREEIAAEIKKLEQSEKANLAAPTPKQTSSAPAPKPASAPLPSPEPSPASPPPKPAESLATPPSEDELEPPPGLKALAETLDEDATDATPGQGPKPIPEPHQTPKPPAAPETPAAPAPALPAGEVELPEAVSLAADDVAAAKAAALAAPKPVPEPAPTPRRSRRHDRRGGKPEPEAPQPAPKPAPAASSAPKAPAAPSEPAKDSLLPGKLIMPSANFKRDAPQPAHQSGAKPPKLAKGEVFVDKDGNVLVGE